MSRNSLSGRLLGLFAAVLFALSFAPYAIADTAAIIAAPSVSVAPNQQIAVPVSYTQGTGNPISIQLRITWDPAVATLVSVQAGALVASNWTLEPNTATPGVARIALATGGGGLNASGELLVLNFTGAAQVGVTPITFAAASLNEGQIAVTTTPGSLRVNTPPVAGNDAYSTDEDTQLVVVAPGVKAGDSDTDGDSLTVSLATQAAHGVVALAADGSFTYMPAANYFGPDSFTYTLVDQWGATDTGSVALTVNSVNDVPVANAGGPYSVPEGGSVLLAGSATDVDDTSGFTFEWDLDGTNAFATIGATPSFSAAALDGPTSVTIKLRVRDSQGGLSVPVNATINVTNVAPTADPGGPYFVAAGGSVQLDGSASSDPAGAADPLTYAWDLNDDGTYETTGVNPLFDAAGLADQVITIRLKVTDDAPATSGVAETTVTISALPRYGLSGAVRYWQDLRPVVGASLGLSGAASASTTSAGGGAWSFNNLLGGNYTVTPQYAADSDAISAYDAALVLQHVANNMVLTGSAAIAANANQTGGISALDASLILQHTVGLIPVPFTGGGQVWTFDPPTLGYTALGATQTGQNFTAILLGDPSGNWDGVTASAAAVGSGASLRVISGQPEADGARTFSVLLDADTQRSVSSVELELAYDDSLFTVEEPQAASGWMMAANRGQAGHLRVALATAQPATKTGAV